MVAVLADIGSRHGSDPARAREMVAAAAAGGAAAVALSWQRAMAALDLPALAEAARRQGMVFALTVDDAAAVAAASSAVPSALRLAAPRSADDPVHAALCARAFGSIHLPVGAMAEAELIALVAVYESAGRARDLVLFAGGDERRPDDPLGLAALRRLRDVVAGRIGGIGFAGRHLGVAADVAACSLGATWIVRPFGREPALRGADPGVLDPRGLRRLVRDLRSVATAAPDPAQSRFSLL